MIWKFLSCPVKYKGTSSLSKVPCLGSLGGGKDLSLRRA